MAAKTDDWTFPSYEEIRTMLRRQSPHLPVDDMTIGEVWMALGRDDPCPPCPTCGVAGLLLLLDEPTPNAATHRCEVCGAYCHWEEPPCA